jgi:hypothetical protein
VSRGRLADPRAPGTVYATSVSGSKAYGVTRRWSPLMARIREGAQLYQVVSVEGDRLLYESRGLDGGLVDAFELVKKARAASGYLDRAPRPADGARKGGPGSTAPGSDR